MKWIKNTKTLDCSLRLGFSVCFDGWFWPLRKPWASNEYSFEILLPGVVVVFWRYKPNTVVHQHSSAQHRQPQ